MELPGQALGRRVVVKLCAAYLAALPYRVARYRGVLSAF